MTFFKIYYLFHYINKCNLRFSDSEFLFKFETSDLPEVKMAVPSFLNFEYFENILQKYYRDNTLKVISAKVGPCGAPGDGFASTMYRVEIHTEQGEKKIPKRGNFIVKMMPTLQLAIDKLGSGSFDVQTKEMEIFQQVFPEFIKTLKKINEDKNIFPKAIAVDRIKDVLILEDLNDKKFVMADRKACLDSEHLKLSLAKLARFHAASMISMEKDPKIFENYVGMFSRKTSAFHDYISSHMDALINEISTWDDHETYLKKLRLLRKNLFEELFKTTDNDPGEIKVLLHGDLWVNNIMFSYDNHGSLNDAIIVSLMSYKKINFY